MFARSAYMHLKPNSVAEFTQRLEQGRPPSASKTERIPRRNHVRWPGRHGGVRNQFVGQG